MNSQNGSLQESNREHEVAVEAKNKNGFVQTFRRLQSTWADYLQRKTNALSPRAKKMALVCFCLMAVAGSTYLLVQSFSSDRSRQMQISQLTVPANATETGEAELRSFAITITRKEMLRIEQFRRYMDSLGGTVRGLRTRDSILAARPRLMDSIRIIEQLYQLKSPKK